MLLIALLLACWMQYAEGKVDQEEDEVRRRPPSSVVRSTVVYVYIHTYFFWSLISSTVRTYSIWRIDRLAGLICFISDGTTVYMGVTNHIIVL